MPTSYELLAAAKAYNIRQIAPIMLARKLGKPYDLETPTLEEEAGLLILNTGSVRAALYSVKHYHAMNTCHGQECVSWASLETFLAAILEAEGHGHAAKSIAPNLGIQGQE